MKLQYYAKTDSLYSELRDKVGVEVIEIADGVNVDLGEDGRAVAFDIDRASQRVDLACLATVGLPVPCG